jgi:hypothetical protein
MRLGNAAQMVEQMRRTPGPALWSRPGCWRRSVTPQHKRTAAIAWTNKRVDTFAFEGGERVDGASTGSFTITEHHWNQLV